MTLFIVSLFLPYTVNFSSKYASAAASQQTTPPESDVTTPAVGRHDPEDNPFSIWQAARSMPKTPGATTSLENIFQPHVDRSLSSNLSFKLRKLSLSANTSASNLSTKSMLRDPHLMPLHSPADVNALYRNQPMSKALAAPPHDVRHYNTQAANVFNTELARAPRQIQSRVSSNEKYTEDNYTIEHAGQGNGGLYHVIDAVSDAGILGDKSWIGLLGMPTDSLDDNLKSVIAENLQDEHHCLPVYVPDGDFDGHYEHFCKTILWPIFHYQIPDHPKSKAYLDHSWIYYVKVNQAFASRIIKNYKKGDTIWIHDYHLMLLPQMLRDKLPDAKIGFFMHTAFPSSEVFRVLATRVELCEGLLGTNMIGFQIDEYAQHFLQTCSRILNVEANADGVFLEDGRFVHVVTTPIGINPKNLDKMRALPEVTDWTTQIAERYAGKRIIVSRDKLESIHFAKDTVLIQIATSGCEDNDIAAKVADVVTRINGTWSTLAHQPVVYLRQDIDHSQYLALLGVAECLLVTCLREGMNLAVHEYIYCQDGRLTNRKYNSVVLSEFTGSASLFGKNALLVNPWHHRACADAIKQALTMCDADKKTRWDNMYDVVMKQDGTKWFNVSMQQLDHAWTHHSDRDVAKVPRLSVPDLVLRYGNSKRRLIILDYEGTLVSSTTQKIMFPPPKRLTDILDDLMEDPKNTVYVMSSRMPEELEQLFKLVPGIGLIAEDGAFIREAGAADEWLELADLDHVSKWKEGIRDMLKYSTDRVEGSLIQERHSSLVFDYTDADDMVSAVKHAAECANHINEACANQQVQALPIDNGISVSGSDLNKSTAAAMIDENLRKQSVDEGEPDLDFLLVIGDSREDEYVFEWAQEQKNQGIVENVFTVTLGSRNTSAGATLTQGVTGVVSALKKLAATA
ncbi:uncharacterized protein AB675_375 [Cyphellophora attinorum]|uniref:Uncharacterized protein n=1 Tax=Cyphellophora attinorum TaxID=1664694 RepID=A0A0N1HC81_9EURO|nr:uncharacterized protein AB675_375 [Phialophora attinorum]KPI45993.1 hypothetical protein AB675_375 [Phialophora attinorum]